MPKFSRLFEDKVLGRGAFRTAWLMSNGMVIKKAHSEGAYYANLTENAIWNTVNGTEYEELFVPIFACSEDGSWVIMPKVETPEDYVKRTSGSYNDRMIRQMTTTQLYSDRTKALKRLGITDLKTSNRTWDGKSIDYGLLWNFSTDPRESAKYVKERM